MPASNQGDYRQADDVVLAPDNLAEGIFQLRRAMRNGSGGFKGHYWNSTMRLRGATGYGGYESTQQSALSIQPFNRVVGLRTLSCLVARCWMLSADCLLLTSY